MSIPFLRPTLLLALALGIAFPSRAGDTDLTAGLQYQTITVPDIPYLKVGSVELKLDVYTPANQLGEEPWVRFTEARKPTLLYIHGGGWNALSRSVRNLNLLPFIQKGWCVVNIDYRLLSQAPMPACIADCRQALNWIYENANTYKFDTSRIVVAGESAGGHLALMTGLLTSDEAIRIDGHPIPRPLRVAAIINWYGIADLERRMKSKDPIGSTELMFGPGADLAKLFHLCSPMSYISARVPPVLTIHGDQDQIVPYEQATLLHEALEKAKAKHRLLTVKGKKHGDFNEKDLAGIYGEIWKFLKDAGI